MNVYLISCVKKKKYETCCAKDLYTSTLFKKAYQYAKSNNADKIFILSAKYGLVDENDVIEYYDETLINKTENERKEWAKQIVQDLKKHVDLQNDNFIILAGKKYNKYILPDIVNYSLPVEGLQIGKQLAFYKKYEK